MRGFLPVVLFTHTQSAHPRKALVCETLDIAQREAIKLRRKPYITDIAIVDAPTRSK